MDLNLNIIGLDYYFTFWLALLELVTTPVNQLTVCFVPVAEFVMAVLVQYLVSVKFKRVPPQLVIWVVVTPRVMSLLPVPVLGFRATDRGQAAFLFLSCSVVCWAV